MLVILHSFKNSEIQTNIHALKLYKKCHFWRRVISGFKSILLQTNAKGQHGVKLGAFLYTNCICQRLIGQQEMLRVLTCLCVCVCVWVCERQTLYRSFITARAVDRPATWMRVSSGQSARHFRHWVDVSAHSSKHALHPSKLRQHPDSIGSSIISAKDIAKISKHLYDSALFPNSLNKKSVYSVAELHWFHTYKLIHC